MAHLDAGPARTLNQVTLLDTVLPHRLPIGRTSLVELCAFEQSGCNRVAEFVQIALESARFFECSTGARGTPWILRGGAPVSVFSGLHWGSGVAYRRAGKDQSDPCPISLGRGR